MYLAVPSTFSSASTRVAGFTDKLVLSHGDFLLPVRGSGLDGIHDLLVARAAAQIAGNRLADFDAVRARIGSQQRLARQDHARDAETALHRAVINKRLLQIAGTAVRAAHAFDRDHLAAAGLGRQRQAAIDQPPIQQHRAGPALADPTALLGAGQAEGIAQERSAGKYPLAPGPARVCRSG